MGKYWDRYLLRNDYAFDNIIEEVAIDYAVRVQGEEDTTPLHIYRVAMANRILANRQDPVVILFYQSLKNRAVRENAFLTAAFSGNPTNPQTGEREARAEQISDVMLEAGIDSVFNHATLEAWPTIQEDVDAVLNPPDEPGGDT